MIDRMISEIRFGDWDSASAKPEAFYGRTMTRNQIARQVWGVTTLS